MNNKSRLLREEDIIRVVDKHTNDDGSLDNDISCILEEVKSPWTKCIEGQMPEDFKENKDKKIINVLVTTSTGKVTKVQRMYDSGVNAHWYWGRIYGQVKAWMPLPEPYVEKE